MTVKELIKALQQYPEDMEVVKANKDDNTGETIVTDVDAARMKEVVFDDFMSVDVIATGKHFDTVADTVNKVVLL